MIGIDSMQVESHPVIGIDSMKLKNGRWSKGLTIDKNWMALNEIGCWPNIDWRQERRVRLGWGRLGAQ